MDAPRRRERCLGVRWWWWVSVGSVQAVLAKRAPLPLRSTRPACPTPTPPPPTPVASTSLCTRTRSTKQRQGARRRSPCRRLWSLWSRLRSCGRLHGCTLRCASSMRMNPSMLCSRRTACKMAPLDATRSLGWPSTSPTTSSPTPRSTTVTSLVTSRRRPARRRSQASRSLFQCPPPPSLGSPLSDRECVNVNASPPPRARRAPSSERCHERSRRRVSRAACW